MGERIVNKKPLKRLSRTKLAIFISILSVIMITGVTLAWFHYQAGEDVELDVGKVELSASIVVKEDLSTVVPGELIVESSSFYKGDDAVTCYVRAVLEYHSEDENLTREEKNYMLALNSYDYSANIATGIDGTSWLSTNDGYYYLVDSEGDFVEVDDDTTYTFASNVIFPSVILMVKEGLVIDTQVPGLKLKVKFQAVQSEYLPSNTLDGIIDIFNLCFDENVKDEFLIRFDTNGEYKIAPQVVKMNGKVEMPEITNDEGAVAKWYVDEALTQEFDFETAVKMGYILYVDWVIEEPAITQGLIMAEDVVIGYVGDANKVVIPATYSLSGERIPVQNVLNNISEFFAVYMKIMMFGSEFEYDLFPVTWGMDGEVYTFNTMEELEEFTSSFSEEDIVYPIDFTYYIDEMVEGEDFEVTTIGVYAFIDMTLLSDFTSEGQMRAVTGSEVYEVVMPEGITTIEEMAFGGQTLYSVSLPSTLQTVEDMAFYQTQIFNLSIPNMIPNFAANAFEGSVIYELYNNSGVNIADSADVVSNLSDLNDSSMYTYYSKGDTMYFTVNDDSVALCGISSIDKDNIIEVPNSGVTINHLFDDKTMELDEYYLNDRMLFDNYNISALILNDNVSDVGEAAFYNTKNLEYVLVESSEVANLIAIMKSTYLLQDSGYNGLNFIATDLDNIYISDNTTGKKWVRYGNADKGYKYYIEHEVDFGFSNGLRFEDEAVILYTGDDLTVVIPETYSLAVGTTSAYLAEFMVGIGEIPYPFTLHTPYGDFEVADEMSFYFVLMNIEQNYILDMNEFLRWEITYTGYVPIPGDDYTVTTIAQGAFSGNPYIISVTLPSTITTIEDYSFDDCPKLVEIINYSSLDISFDNTENFGGIKRYAKNIITSESNTKLVNKDNFIFYNGGTDDIHLMGYVGDESELVLPSSFNGNNYTIYDYAFQYMFINKNLLDVESVTIPSCVTSIGDCAFNGCINLNQVIYNATNVTDCASYSDVFVGAGQNGFDVIIGANVTRIPAYLFEDSYISSIAIPQNSQLTAIGGCAFYGCTLLNSITIPSNVTMIGDAAFLNATSLLEVINLSDLELEVNTSNYGYVAYYALNIETTNNTKIVTTSNGLRYYNGGAGRTYLIRYTGNAESVELPANLGGNSYYIYDNAFYENMNVKNVVMSSGVLGIGKYAFYGCQLLQSITIPQNVTSIGDYAFAKCYKVSEINFNATNLPDFTGAHHIFENVGGKGNGVVVNIGANVTRIPNYLFDVIDWPSDIDALDSYTEFHINKVVFDEGSVCASIGVRAFFILDEINYNTYRIHNINLPNSITSIDATAFDSYSISSCYALCESSTVAQIAITAGLTNAYLIDTTTDFSSITFTESAGFAVNSNGNITHVRTGSEGSYKYYTKYVAA